jgi:uncharacterized protein (DUF885 family)
VNWVCKTWRVAALLFLLSGSLTGFAQAQSGDNQAKVLEALYDAEWEWGLQEDPVNASHLGDPRFNRRWPDVRQEAYERRFRHRQETLQKLQRIDASRLSPLERLNYRLFRRQYEFAVEEFPFDWHLVPLTQMEGIQDASSLADVLRFNTVADYRDWLARLDGLPDYLHETTQLMRAGIIRKLLLPKVVMERVPRQIVRQVVDDPDQSLFFKPFRKFPDSIAAADQQELLAAARRVIRERVVPAYRTFATFFEQEYLPASLPEVGVWQVPRGAALYEMRARQFTTTKLTPEEIHEIGLSEVRRIRKEMESIVRQVGFQGSFREFLAQLRTDPKFYYRDANELLLAYQQVCRQVDPQLPKLFRKLPRTPYIIEAIPEHIAPDTTTAYYRPPSADGSRPGAYCVNLYRPEVRPKYEIEALSLHEAVPGHHLQIALATELEGLPTFRRFTSFTAFVEGWALYTERLGPDLGLYRDPYAKFGQLTYEMWRAIRLVVDTGMHSKKWTREQAIAFFAENAAKSEADIANEVDRYIVWPGQALAYKIGEIKIRELRARAEQVLGNKFDIREFHDVILRQGAVPLDVLEEIVAEWLAEASR